MKREKWLHKRASRTHFKEQVKRRVAYLGVTKKHTLYIKSLIKKGKLPKLYDSNGHTSRAAYRVKIGQFIYKVIYDSYLDELVTVLYLNKSERKKVIKSLTSTRKLYRIT